MRIEIPFPKTVFAGNCVDLSIDMKALMRGGQQRRNWEIKNPPGDHFRVGSSGKDLFWVSIIELNPLIVQGFSSSYAFEYIYFGLPGFGGTLEGAFDW